MFPKSTKWLLEQSQVKFWMQVHDATEIEIVGIKADPAPASEVQFLIDIGDHGVGFRVSVEALFNEGLLDEIIEGTKAS